MTDAMDVTTEEVAPASDLILPAEPEPLVVTTGAQAALDLAKLKCVEGESDEEHAAHKDELAAAYADFAADGGGTPSNPAPEGETGLDADVSMHLDG